MVITLWLIPRIVFRPCDEEEDVSGEEDPDIIEDGEEVICSDSEDEEEDGELAYEDECGDDEKDEEDPDWGKLQISDPSYLKYV